MDAPDGLTVRPVRPPCTPVCRVCGNPRCPGVRVRRPRKRRNLHRAGGLAGAAVLAGNGLLAAGPSIAARAAPTVRSSAQMRVLSGPASRTCSTGTTARQRRAATRS